MSTTRGISPSPLDSYRLTPLAHLPFLHLHSPHSVCSPCHHPKPLRFLQRTIPRALMGESENPKSHSHPTPPSSRWPQASDCLEQENESPASGPPVGTDSEPQLTVQSSPQGQAKTKTLPEIAPCLLLPSFCLASLSPLRPQCWPVLGEHPLQTTDTQSLSRALLLFL